MSGKFSGNCASGSNRHDAAWTVQATVPKLALDMGSGLLGSCRGIWDEDSRNALLCFILNMIPTLPCVCFWRSAKGLRESSST